MKKGPVTMRISRSSESLSVAEDFIAARYQRLENPRIFSSSGITSSVVPRWTHRPFPGVFLEPQRSQPIAKRRIFRVGGDFGDRIHIERGSRIGGGLVGNEEARDGSSHKDEFTKQRAQKARRSD
jgi:hypothetical protein